MSPDYVYVFCGYSTSEKTKSIERYSLKADEWGMMDLEAKGGVWRSRDFIRAFTDNWGQVIVFGEYNGGDRTFVMEEEEERMRVGKV